LGGIVTQVYQNRVVRGREDRELLLKALDILIDLEPILNGIASAVPPSNLTEPCKGLWSNARRIQTKHYYGLAEKLIEFGLKSSKHTKKEADKLIGEIAKEISKPYFGYYRKEKEFFEKLTKEMREGREKENKGREK